VTNFLGGTCFSPEAKHLVSSIIEALIGGNSIETLKYLLPKTCESIDKIMNNSESIVLLTDHKGDIELTSHLILFATLLSAHGDALLVYKKMIMSVFHQCIHIINKDCYEAVDSAARNLLDTLSQVYPKEFRLTVENINEPFIEFLPIRVSFSSCHIFFMGLIIKVWGQSVDYDKLQVQYHYPNKDEIDFAREFVDTFIYSELTLLNENILKLSNNERLRSLNFIRSIAEGCFRMVPRIESPQVIDL
jgi:hypothetical protein